MYDSSLEKLKKLLQEKKVSPSIEGIKKEEDKFDEINFFLSKEKKITDELTKQINLSSKAQTIIGCDSSNNLDVSMGVINFILNSNKTPVFVLTTTNYNQFLNYLSEKKIDSKKLFLVDTVSKNISKVSESENLFFVDSLRNLTQLQIKLINIINDSCVSEKECVIVFDSMDVLSLYHDDSIILKFVYSITKLFHKYSVSGIFLSSKSPFLPKLVQFFDDFVELKKF
jgi:hypothetical protein